MTLSSRGSWLYYTYSYGQIFPVLIHLSHNNLLYILLFLPVFFPVQFSCKSSVVFCHYCVMANFFWLLVEALYLNSLLLSSFCHSRRCLWVFSLLGWGEKPWHAVSLTFVMLSCRVWFQYEIFHIWNTVSYVILAFTNILKNKEWYLVGDKGLQNIYILQILDTFILCIKGSVCNI